MIKKIYWYCPMCNYSPTVEPKGSACTACGYGDFTNKPTFQDYIKQIETEEEMLKINQFPKLANALRKLGAFLG